VISITDGQIFLESDLFYQGIRTSKALGADLESELKSALETFSATFA